MKHKALLCCHINKQVISIWAMNHRRLYTLKQSFPLHFFNPLSNHAIVYTNTITSYIFIILIEIRQLFTLIIHPESSLHTYSCLNQVYI